MRFSRKNRLQIAVCWSSPWKPIERLIVPEDDEDAYPTALTFTRLHPAEMRQAAVHGGVNIPDAQLPRRVQEEAA